MKLEDGFGIALGSVMGFLFVFGDYSSGGKATNSIWDQPRVKNLMAMLGGVAAPLGASYLKGLNSTEISHITIEYGMSAILSVFFWFLAVCFAISINVWRRNATHPRSDHLGTIPLILEFLARGYGAYTALRESVLDAIAKRKELSDGVIPSIMKKIDALLMAVYAHRSPTGPIYDRSFMIKLILKAIAEVATELLNVGSARITANFMLSVRRSDATQDHLNFMRFSAAPHQGVEELLVLEHFNGVETPNFTLPVHADISACLPGAPSAFKLNDYQIVNCKSPFRKRSSINAHIKKDMVAYFDSKKIRSFVSIPMINGSKVVGVVNIDSDTDIFDPKDVGVVHLANSLHPFCTILGSIATED